MIEHYKNLLQFDHWANEAIARVLENASELPEKTRELLSHILAAHWLWLNRIGATDKNMPVWPEIRPGDWRDQNDQIWKTWNSYLDSLSPTDLDLSTTYRNTKGEGHINTAGEIITHVLHHSAYHRGQINQILRANDIEPPYVDYIHYARSVVRC